MDIVEQPDVLNYTSEFLIPAQFVGKYPAGVSNKVYSVFPSSMFISLPMSECRFRYWFYKSISLAEARGSVVDEALCYKPEGRGFDFWCGHWIF
jgi:hypothetical protein